MGFVRPGQRCGCLSSVWRPVRAQNTACLSLCERDARRRGSGHFQDTSPAPRGGFVCLLFSQAEVKQMGCNVNTRLLMQHCAKKCLRPRVLNPSSIPPPPSSIPPLHLHPRPLPSSFPETNPRSWRLPARHRRQRHKPTCPHPLLVHATAASSPPERGEREMEREREREREREVRLRAVSFSAG